MNDEESNDIDNNIPSWDKPCHLCGCPDFTWGFVWASELNRPPYRLIFVPEGYTPEDGGYHIEARRCKQCGNIQFYGSM